MSQEKSLPASSPLQGWHWAQGCCQHVRMHRARFLDSVASMPPNKLNYVGGSFPGHWGDPTPICEIASPGPGAEPSPDGRVARPTSDHTSALGPQRRVGGILQGVTLELPVATHPSTRLFGGKCVFFITSKPHWTLIFPKFRRALEPRSGPPAELVFQTVPL